MNRSTCVESRSYIHQRSVVISPGPQGQHVLTANTNSVRPRHRLPVAVQSRANIDTESCLEQAVESRQRWCLSGYTDTIHHSVSWQTKPADVAGSSWPSYPHSFFPKHFCSICDTVVVSTQYQAPSLTRRLRFIVMVEWTDVSPRAG
jgi:hypothetical protein